LSAGDTSRGSGRGLKGSKAKIGQLLERGAQKYGIPTNILKAVAYQESGWRANAKSFDGHHGKGVMQIDDRYHQFAKTAAVWDPAQNIDYGARYLKGLYNKTGSWARALKRYNGGSSYPPKIMALTRSQPWRRWA
jgi:soluble lytic murein transglycosylase-like protein